MNDIETFAPVVIPTLNRYKHFKRCINSLRRCALAEETEVIVSIDFPPSEKYKKGYLQICDYLDNFQGFRKLTVIKQVKNLGVVGNYQFLKSYVSRLYDKYILTEDDNEFSPMFLEFMNSALTLFKDDPSIMSICGYTSVPYYNSSKEKIILTYDTSAWGYGTWVNKQENYFKSGMAYYHNIALSFSNSLKILRRYPALLSMLLDMLKKGAFYGDTMFSTYNIINNTYQLRPSISMVRNWGQDGTGAHSGIDDNFSKQIIQNAECFDLNTISIVSVYEEINTINRCSFWMGLPKNKIRACYSILGIIHKWFKYFFNHPNYNV